MNRFDIDKEYLLSEMRSKDCVLLTDSGEVVTTEDLEEMEPCEITVDLHG